MELTLSENMGNKKIQYFLNEQVRLAFYLRFSVCYSSWKCLLPLSDGETYLKFKQAVKSFIYRLNRGRTKKYNLYSMLS